MSSSKYRINTMCSSDQALIATIAGVQTQVDGITSPMKSLTLKTDGPEALLDQIFTNDGLFTDPHKNTALQVAAKQLAQWKLENYDIIPIFDERYPQQLRQIHEAPGLIFSTGTICPDDLAVSVVGSRNAGPKELKAASDIAEQLAAEGITVVSGLARGIDAAAHESALRVGGRTVAVMGTGIDQTYPAEHNNLRQRIESQQGQIITQFFPGSTTAKHNFPMRNATMSGYGVATIVIAASEKSGTRHQARAAIGHGRALILTPGVVRNTSWGRKYVEKGDAYVAESPEQAVCYALEVFEKNQNISDELLSL